MRPLLARVPTRGFTLLELLVVMSLMSLVMLAMTSALRTMAQTEERVDARVARADDLRSSLDFLRGALGRVAMRKVPMQSAAQGSPYLFQGGADAMVWVGIMPARFGAGGRYVFRLGPEALPQGQTLTLRFAPWNPMSGFPDWALTEMRPLVLGLTGFSIQYEDVRRAPGQWQPEWMPRADAPPDRVNQFPARVRLLVQTSQGTWPDVIIPLRVMSSSSSSLGGFTVGGGSQD
ncbi:prepilin-type N-terminal cleavage/methylation domain-containing protein [Curvibacter sp. HBC28]|uniref:Prepilin-type N-terminal cleavage/methylation domain-containing protein n=1 Tax=Curvibacter microcysteis TaxID=3026419 RepID=A0ABT5MED9_9BURK|nr:prepilin-type N-terminal cleavage/methylation domain-containing protein [Curvibacter sp. HBC28]